MATYIQVSTKWDDDAEIKFNTADVLYILPLLGTPAIGNPGAGLVFICLWIKYEPETFYQPR